MNVAERQTCPSQPAAKETVLAIDLDGTLLKTDLLLESMIGLLKQQPWRILMLPFWLLKGRAHLKREIAKRVALDVSGLPYRQELLEYLKARRSQGSMIVLATATDAKLARQVADYLGVFDYILASDGVHNLSGRAKRDRLIREFGAGGFEYAGNDEKDLTVWAAASKAILVNPKNGMRAQVGQMPEVECVFADEKPTFADRIKIMRPQHWIKNLLVFAPLLAAHRMEELGLVAKASLAFLTLGCMASSGYLMNDLLDLAADRRHPTKRFRAFASGKLPLAYGLIMIPLLVAAGCLSGAVVSKAFVAAALGYFALSLTYSLFVKRFVILDVLFLAGLYTARIFAGAIAVAVWPSHWLLAFSTFLFLSLALAKRYGELAIMKRTQGDSAKARAYELSDGELLAAMGIASGYLAVLVLALYINSDVAQMLYARYQLMWFLCPLLLYWISDIWLIAHRGRMPDDPVFFAINDRTSQILMGLMIVTSVLAL